MSRHEDSVRLRDMVEHGREALAMGRGLSAEEIATDRPLGLAIVRLLEIVGEAAAQLSPETREKYPDIRWRGIVGLRNRLIHAYRRVDYNVIREILNNDLPELIEKVERILQDSSVR